jgi:GDP-L-fucose synthase
VAKILVLGGTGFLGGHVVAALEEQGHAATVASRRTGCDLMDLVSFERTLAGVRPDAIINCAAHVGSVHYAIQHAAEMIHDNTLMVINLYRGAQRIVPSAKIVNPISNCSYPGEANVHCEPDWMNGPVHDTVLSYGMPRRMIYAISESYRKQYNTHTINWLIANAYGPGDYLDPNKVHALNGIIIRLMKAQKAGDKTFEIWGSGKPTREWVYIGDAARMLAHSIDLPDQVYPLNLAQNQAYSITEIARIAADILHYNPEFTFNTRMADGAPFKRLDDRQFRAKYPDFQFTPIADGIRETVAYYQQQLFAPATRNSTMQPVAV